MMFGEDLLAEQVKKKKRRVLVILVMFLLLGLGGVMVFPPAELALLSSTASPEAAAAVPTRTATPPRPTAGPAGTATSMPAPSVEATVAGSMDVPPGRTATAAAARLTPTVTEGMPDGYGGGALETPPSATSVSPEATPGRTATDTAAQLTLTPADVTPLATVASTDASAAVATPRPSGPSELPAAGAAAGWVTSGLTLGLVATALGALMLAAGYALLHARPTRR
jgi:hypothetical protein